ncbi:squalene-hopene cyclase [Rhodopirellula maiorica SM1]|uniref:Squalene-hopene cyclase n=1 Tax=Rhodopirellula maiorica SM1 TaxID=1265738 RepID=M5RP29_9BACT|nr:prenyltransferase/squalene oxidase repeat-containing protein [Rhodopirellula maiorica]EMI17142.1 squalene-hopene cyclase [Rhodopirellula maiorica SM1]
MESNLRQRVRGTLDQLRSELLAQRTAEGHWVGELSASALSTATAISALSATLIHAPRSIDNEDAIEDQIVCGMQYLSQQQNADGGFGDTDRSHSNIATSYLVLAASSLAKQSRSVGLESNQLAALEAYIKSEGKIDGLRRRYGKDKTFVVPILANMAIAGLVSWDDVPRLPFEASVFPQSMYRVLQMPVVSYAIPALVAIGQARHFHGSKTWLPIRLIRAAAVNRSMRVLRRMQPDSGGYLEATPLTSFVLMSLAATGRGDCEVSRDAIRFLTDSMNTDGSWPIDTNLATWITSLSISALASDPDDDGSWFSPSLVDWHLGCQHRQRHPFTGAQPGGWGWTDLSGAVPDGDDTPGAVLAVKRMQRHASGSQVARMDTAISEARQWLIDLQNRDGGWPTFCRGWGKLPFDRSSTDLTAHALRAFGENGLNHASKQKAERFLTRHQADDGSWLPLWFGNQDHPAEDNPVYGTSRVLLAGAAGFLSDEAIRRGASYLCSNQNADGGWGGGASILPWMKRDRLRDAGVQAAEDLTSSVEETAVAIEALTAIYSKNGRLSTNDHGKMPKDSIEFAQTGPTAGKNDPKQVIIRGVEFLLQSVHDGRHRVPWPIGFYFAKLWYHEKLYPLVFTVAALSSFLRSDLD